MTLTTDDLDRFARLCALKRDKHETMLTMLVDDVEELIRSHRAQALSEQDISTLKAWRDGLVYEHGRLAVEPLTNVLDKLLARAVR